MEMLNGLQGSKMEYFGWKPLANHLRQLEKEKEMTKKLCIAQFAIFMTGIILVSRDMSIGSTLGVVLLFWAHNIEKH